MPLQFYDRIKETTTTTGTGAKTLLGAVSQFSSFTSRFADGEPFFAAVVGQSGTEWETGQYTLSSGTLVSLQVEYSSNGDAAVNFSAGTKDVFNDLSAFQLNQLMTHGHILATAMGWAMP